MKSNRDLVIRYLSKMDGPVRMADIAEATGLEYGAVATAVQGLFGDGRVTRPVRGAYQLRPDVAEQAKAVEADVMAEAVGDAAQVVDMLELAYVGMSGVVPTFVDQVGRIWWAQLADPHAE